MCHRDSLEFAPLYNALWKLHSKPLLDQIRVYLAKIKRCHPGCNSLTGSRHVNITTSYYYPHLSCLSTLPMSMLTTSFPPHQKVLLSSRPGCGQQSVSILLFPRASPQHQNSHSLSLLRPFRKCECILCSTTNNSSKIIIFALPHVSLPPLFHFCSLGGP